MALLKLYVSMLGDWNRHTNLVSRNSLADVWRRHVWDSAQLTKWIGEDARSLVDLGSGAGFPALVLAVILRHRGLRFVLYESIAKKCRFLEAVAQRLNLTVEIRNERIESVTREPFDVVTARACAPLPLLLSYAAQFHAKNTLCLFLKGRTAEAEVARAGREWAMDVKMHASLTDTSGVILEIRGLRHAG